MSPALPSTPNLTLVISGEPTEIERLAGSLDTTRALLEEVDKTVTYDGGRVASPWGWQAAEAYLHARSTVLTANLKLLTYMDDVSQVFWAYAERIRLGQEYFDELLVNAAEVGLKVVGRTIHHPTTWLNHIPAQSDRYVSDAQARDKRFARPTPHNRATAVTGNVGSREHEYNEALTPEFNEFLRYQRLISVYNEVSTKVGLWHGEIDEWLKEHMVPLVSRIEELEKFPSIFAALRRGTETAVDAGLSAMEHRTRVDLQWLRNKQGEYSRIATDMLTGSLLGNPLQQGAYSSFDLDGNKATIAGLEAEIQRVENHARILRGVGQAGTVVSIVGLADGVIHGSLDINTLVGTGADAAGTAVASGLTSVAGYGAAGTLAVTAGAGMVIAGYGKLAWEVEVPLKTKEAINFWLNASVGWDPHDATLKAAYFDRDQLPYLVDELGPLP